MSGLFGAKGRTDNVLDLLLTIKVTLLLVIRD
jgi:hypothetical protein